MIQSILSLLKDVTTTKDGETFDVVRVLMIAGGAALIGFTGFDVIAHHTPLDALAFGGGFAAVLGGGGAGISLKRKDEPA